MRCAEHSHNQGNEHPINMMKIASAFLVFLSSRAVSAYSNGAGRCAAGGIAAVGGTHLEVESITTGSLADGGYTVTVAGAAAFDSVTIPNVGIPFNVEISGPTFKGALIFVGDQPDSIIAPGTDMTLATGGLGCAGTASVTHISASPKSIALATLTVDAPISTFLDLNIVVNNSGGISTYYYSRIALNVVGEGGPTVSPTMVATDSDTFVGTAAPTVTGATPSPTTAVMGTVPPVGGTPAPTVTGATPSPTIAVMGTVPTVGGTPAPTVTGGTATPTVFGATAPPTTPTAGGATATPTVFGATAPPTTPTAGGATATPTAGVATATPTAGVATATPTARVATTMPTVATATPTVRVATASPTATVATTMPTVATLKPTAQVATEMPTTPPLPPPPPPPTPPPPPKPTAPRPTPSPTSGTGCSPASPTGLRPVFDPPECNIPTLPTAPTPTTPDGCPPVAQRSVYEEPYPPGCPRSAPI
jgi:hypothetical protein